MENRLKKKKFFFVLGIPSSLSLMLERLRDLAENEKQSFLRRRETRIIFKNISESLRGFENRGSHVQTKKTGNFTIMSPMKNFMAYFSTEG